MSACTTETLLAVPDLVLYADIAFLESLVIFVSL